MLCKVKNLKGYKIHGTDGEIGTVKEFFFDDHHWTVRYLIADTGSWLTGRQVLISPYALVAINSIEKHISVDLTKEQIEQSPPLSSDKPVSRQFEEVYYEYFDWPMYFYGPYAWGANSFISREKGQWTKEPDSKSWDSHLRSTKDVTGYHVQAVDGDIGYVDDFIVDDISWTIRYLVIGTQKWMLGKKVLVSPQWIKRVSWNESKVIINLTCRNIEHSEEYSEEALITRDYEQSLHQHYHRKGYWGDGTGYNYFDRQ